ncbi:TEA-domain-containing protein [Trichodelitschia bisporula]|uniref:TEA-domain-containing protein n=1 Tax=Trichodelitschia bisporula TaxID=703511 RepID=A0A6G1I122_9PEZI|nr:TEA-domain-containing protein [Trichodelitschia bisporula]
MDHRVLPSNDPSLPDHLTLPTSGVPQRVLQERSGNRQDELAHSEHHIREMKQSSHSSENEITSHTRRSTNPFSLRHRSEADILEETNRLYNACMEVPEFREYRQGQQCRQRGSKQQIWPDRVELAFMRAIVIYPPIGKGKVLLPFDDKGLGRNELIADAIKKYCGVDRNRKQISSHLQVLKTKFKDNQYVLSRLGNPNERYFRKTKHRASGGRSRRPIPSSPPITPSAPLYTPSDFQMFITDASHPADAQIIHYFTSFRPSPRQPDLHLPSSAHLPSLLPHLSPNLTTPPPPTAQVLFAHASLSLPPFPLPKGSTSLGIQFELAPHPSLSSYTDFRATARFSQNGHPEQDIMARVDRNPKQPSRLVNIHFGSDFWARRFMARAMGLAGRLACRADGAAQALHEAVAALGAVQCLEGLRDGVWETLLLVYWRFELAEPGRKGEASWRGVVFRDSGAAGAGAEGDKLELDELPEGFECEPGAQFAELNFDPGLDVVGLGLPGGEGLYGVDIQGGDMQLYDMEQTGLEGGVELDGFPAGAEGGAEGYDGPWQGGYAAPYFDTGPVAMEPTGDVGFGEGGSQHHHAFGGDDQGCHTGGEMPQEFMGQTLPGLEMSQA